MAATKLRQGKMANSLGRPSLLALTVSISMLGVTPSFAAEEMDYSMKDADSTAFDVDETAAVAADVDVE